MTKAKQMLQGKENEIILREIKRQLGVPMSEPWHYQQHMLSRDII